MTDIAELGFRVDSSQAVTATQRLDKLGDQAAVTERQVQRSGRTATREFRTMGTSLASLSRTPAFRGISIQLSQVAQQATATGQPLRALAIQAADIGMLFGPLGIAIGVAAGALLPFAENLFAAGGGAADLEDELDRLGEAMSALETPMDIIEMSLTELNAKYGEASVRVRQFAVDLANIRVAEAEAALRQQVALIDEVAEAYLNFRGSGQLAEMAGEQETALRAIQRDFGLTEDAAREFEATLRDLSGAASFDQQQIALADILSLLRESGIAASDLPPEFASALAAMIETSNAADELRARIDEAKGVGEDLSGVFDSMNLGNVIADADTLISKLAEATKRAFEFLQTAARHIQLADDEAWQQGLDRQAYGQGQAAARRLIAEGFTLPEVRAPRSGGGRRSGGGGGAAKVSDEVLESQRAAERVMREVERATLDAMSAADRYSHELEDVKELHEAGYLTAEQYARAVDLIDQEFQEAQWEDFRRGIEDISDAIADAIINGEDMGEAFSRILAQMASDILSSGINDLLSGLFKPSGGGGGGGLFSFLGGLFGGKSAPVPDFDGGGYTGDGPRSGGLDGKGGYMAMLHPQETVVDHTKGGGGGVTVVQNFNVSANGDDSVVRILRSQMPAIAEASKNAVLDAKRRGGSYGNNF